MAPRRIRGWLAGAVLALGLGLGVAGSAAAATLITVTASGTGVTGSDTIGTFGLPSADLSTLANRDVTIAFTFALTPGSSIVTVGGTQAAVFDNIAMSFTVNGSTYSVSGVDGGPISAGGGFSLTDEPGGDVAQAQGSLVAGGQLVFSGIALVVDLLGTMLADNAILQDRIILPPVGANPVTMGGSRFDDGVGDFVWAFEAVLTRLEVSVTGVPEPAAAALFGLALLGLGLLARRAVRVPPAPEPGRG